MRELRGLYDKAAAVLLLAFAAYGLTALLTGLFDALTLRALHGAFLLACAFVCYDAVRKDGQGHIPPHDIALAALAAAAFLYFAARYPAVVASAGHLTGLDYTAAALALLLLLCMARRLSPGLFAVAVCFLLYNFIGPLLPGALAHNGFSLKRVLRHLFWGGQGIFGVGANVSATYVFAFMMLGAFLKHSGFSQLLSDLSLALVGHSPGGPAKVAVLGSALLGMINGSAVANVATTGAVTIPLMKRSGYSAEFSGAVEAAASTGGQFTPPVMGAVGFVMAEFMNTPYERVMLAAIFPALLYYITLLLAVHFEAKRLGLRGISRDGLPAAWRLLRARGHLLIPFFALLALIVLGMTPVRAALLTLALVIPVSFLRRETRLRARDVLRALREGASGTLMVGVACMLLGVVIGTSSLTGVGQRVGEAMMALASGGRLAVCALAAMTFCILLGTGVPGVAAYVIVYTVAVPVLVRAGATPMAAHLFCLYYACLSNITPPVAISAYVAAALAQANARKVAFTAVRLALAGFIVPLFFLANPALLLDFSALGAWRGCLSILTATLGCASLAAALFLRGRDTPLLPARLLLLCAAGCMLDAGLATDALGAACVCAAILLIRKDNPKKASLP